MQSDSKSLTQPCRFGVSLQGSDSEKWLFFVFSFFFNCLLFCLFVLFFVFSWWSTIALSCLISDLCLHGGLMQQGVVSQSPEYMHKQYLLVNNWTPPNSGDNIILLRMLAYLVLLQRGGKMHQPGLKKRERKKKKKTPGLNRSVLWSCLVVPLCRVSFCCPRFTSFHWDHSGTLNLAPAKLESLVVDTSLLPPGPPSTCGGEIFLLFA